MSLYTKTEDNYLIVAEQLSLYDFELDNNPFISKIEKHLNTKKENVSSVKIQNRRYLGNKYKLLSFIEQIAYKEIGYFDSFCDIFAGTGVVGNHFNKSEIKIISNDLLYSNFVALHTWLGSKNIDTKKIELLIKQLNLIEPIFENYVSRNFGGIFFSMENARKIGAIREAINNFAIHPEEKMILITSLIYAMDKVANTCGHYDAFRKTLDCTSPIELKLPDFIAKNNDLNEVYQMDANRLIKQIECDVLYIDPPYNSRQYCDTYHLLENIALWGKPIVYGKAKKFDRNHLKSNYCLKSAFQAFRHLINGAKCKHILVSYNNTGEKMDSRSNARISDEQIIHCLEQKGHVKIFEKEYKAFTTGKSESKNHTERIFYCRVE